DAWLRGDLAGLARIGDRMGERFPGMGSHYRELTKHIVHNRTILMHHRLALPLRGGRVFVAVGAMHLYGSRGLLALLQRDGYRVSGGVLISGRGSNLGALADAGLPIAAVLSNRADAAGVEFARGLRIPTAVVAHAAYRSREAFDDALAAEIDRYRPKVVALAGFMRILTPAFTGRYAGRL